MSSNETKEKLARAKLYGIVDLGYLSPESVSSATTALITGGVDLIQLRAKKSSPAEIEEIARELLPLCQEASVPFVINDFPEIAVRVGADGVHIGQDDGSLMSVRSIVGDEMIVGRSTHSPIQARQALADGFDYIGFGPLFPTPTKEGRPGIGLEDIALMESEVGSRIPMFCIGGIKAGNLAEVLGNGARRVVIVSAFLLAEDIAAATRGVRKRLTG